MQTENNAVQIVSLPCFVNLQQQPVPVPATSTTSTANQRGSMDPTMSPQQRSGDVSGTVNVTLLGARNVSAKDKPGISDPYMRVRVGGWVVFKTKTVKKSQQLEWDESFTTEISDGKLLLDIKVKDKNTLNDVDIGDCSLGMEVSSENGSISQRQYVR